MNSKLRIFGAFCVGISLVAGAFFVADQRATPLPDPRVEAVVGTAPERSFIEVTDTDSDGLADWKQTLSTTPLSGIRPSSTTTATTTHTAQVALSTLERLMLGTEPGSTATTETILTSTNAYMDTLAQIDLYDESDLRVSADTSLGALRTYGNRVAEIAFTHDVGGTVDEMTILNRALETQNAAVLEELAPIAQSYRDMTTDMLQTPVPALLQEDHLALINAYHVLATDVSGMQKTFDDAVYALALFQRYWSDGNALYRAIADVYTTLHEEGVRWEATDRASAFIRIRSES